MEDTLSMREIALLNQCITKLTKDGKYISLWGTLVNLGPLEKTWLSSTGGTSPHEELMLDKAFFEPMPSNAQIM